MIISAIEAALLHGSLVHFPTQRIGEWYIRNTPGQGAAYQAGHALRFQPQQAIRLVLVMSLYNTQAQSCSQLTQRAR